MSDIFVSSHFSGWCVVEGSHIAVCISKSGECLIRFLSKSSTGIKIVMHTHSNPDLGDLKKYVTGTLRGDYNCIKELVLILDKRFEEVIDGVFVICNTGTDFTGYNIDFSNGNVYMFGHKIKVSDNVNYLNVKMKSNLLFQLINGMKI